MVSELCSAARLLPCAATCPSVVARAAVARGAIAGASALLSSLEASYRGDSVVQGLDGRRVVAGGCRVHRQVRYLSVRRESQGKLPCGDVRAVSHLSVVQDLRDVAGDRSFKHVFLGVGVIIRIHNIGVLYFSAPSQVLRGIPAVRRFGVVCLTHLPHACWCVKHTNPSSAQVSARVTVRG